MKPIIGISVNTEQRQIGKQQLYYTYLNEAYAQAVVQAGGIPLLIPNVNQSLATEYAQIIDGLVLAGGEDIDPTYYGESCHQETKPAAAHKDASDFAMIAAMLEQEKPILGICRGFQVLNVALGGTLVQDVTVLALQRGSHVDVDSPLSGQHRVNVVKDSVLETLFGPTLAVNSLHHQTIGVLAKSLQATAHSHDGLIEGIEHQTLPIIAVQWHPELLALATEMKSQRLFSYFVQGLCTSKKTNQC